MYYIDYKRGFKVKIICEIKEGYKKENKGRAMVKPYKLLEDRGYVFNNTYIVDRKDVIRIG